MRMILSCLAQPHPFTIRLRQVRWYAAPPKTAAAEENVNVGHARFIAEAKKSQSWSQSTEEGGGEQGTGVDARDIGPARGMHNTSYRDQRLQTDTLLQANFHRHPLICSN